MPTSSNRLLDCIFYHFTMTFLLLAARIFFKGGKFFEQHSPGAVVKPSESGHKRDTESFFPGDEGICGF